MFEHPDHLGKREAGCHVWQMGRAEIANWFDVKSFDSVTKPTCTEFYLKQPMLTTNESMPGKNYFFNCVEFFKNFTLFCLFRSVHDV